MAHTFLRPLVLFSIAALAAVGSASAEECSGAITADEALKAEHARYAAQTSDDYAAMQKLFGDDLSYTHSSAVTDNKASYIERMRSGVTKYRKITPDNDLKTRIYGCVAVITGTAMYEVTSSGGPVRTLPLSFTAVWAKRSSGIEFVSWQSTGIPPKK